MNLLALRNDALRPGDVIFMGIFGAECGDGLCADVISCFNASGQLAFPARFAGVPAALATHTALYLGDGLIAHVSGRDTSFVLGVEDLAAYLAAHPRLVTVLRCADQRVAGEAAALGRALTSGASGARKFTATTVIATMLLQGMFPGRRDEEMRRGFEEALRTGGDCLFTTRCMVSCSAFVGTILCLATERCDRGRALDGIAGDISPFELLAALLVHPLWERVGAFQPDGFARAVITRAGSTPARRSARRPSSASLLWVLAALILVPCVIAVFCLGFGRTLQAALFAVTARRRGGRVTKPDDGEGRARGRPVEPRADLTRARPPHAGAPSATAAPNQVPNLVKAFKMASREGDPQQPDLDAYSRQQADKRPLARSSSCAVA